MSTLVPTRQGTPSLAARPSPVSPLATGRVLDPRTKLLTLLLVNGLVLSNSSTSVVVAGAVLTTLLLLLAGNWRGAGVLVLVFVLFEGTAWAVPVLWSSTPAALLVAAAFWMARFTVSVGLAVFVLSTTGAAQMGAALRRLHMPNALVIPLTVMLRFIPSVVTETRAVVDAMRLRGIFPGPLGVVSHPVRLVQYLMVPLLASCTRLADDLSASALVRGLGAPARPTTIARLGFGVADAVLVTALLLLLALRISPMGGLA